MAMRLVEKKVKMNPETCGPELLITVAMPLEPVKDPAICSVEEAYERIGAEFVKMLETHNNETMMVKI